MKIRLDILRKKFDEDTRYIQSFLYEYSDAGMTVAAALCDINKREPLLDANNAPAEAIRWECSCLQKKCGACAMLINGYPRLACDAKLSEYGDAVSLAPLKKFPQIADLIVDRQPIFDSLKQIGLWFDENARPDDGRVEFIHEASRCLQCGCCLEVCPNFYAGGDFKGMAAAVPLSRLISEASETEKKRIFAEYEKHFYADCGKSLSCKDICPAGIDTEYLMVNSNAAAVWKRKRR